MSAAVRLREDVSADELRVMARESRDSRQYRRLLALAAMAEGRSRAESQGGNHAVSGPSAQPRARGTGFGGSGPRGATWGAEKKNSKAIPPR